MLSRRAVLGASLGAGVASLGLGLPGLSWAAGQARELSLYNIHTDETFKGAFAERGVILPDAMQALTRLLRDYRTDETYPMDLQLLVLVSELQRRLGANEPLQIVSAYRSPRTNAMLGAKSGEVARSSLHTVGQAMDITFDQVPVERVQQLALSLGMGGVGYYPVTKFVHVDVGSARQWRGT